MKLSNASFRFYNDSLLFHHIKEEEHARLKVKPEHHNFYEIYYLAQGTVEFGVEGIPYVVRPGEILLVGINEVHSLKLQNDMIYERYVLQFSNYTLPFNPRIINMLVSIFTPECRQIPAEKVSEFRLLRYLKNIEIQCNKLGQCSDGADGDYVAAELDIAIIRFIVQLHKAISDSKPIAPPPNHDDRLQSIVSKAIAYIDAHIGENITLDQIAKDLYIDKFYLSRCFSQNINISIKQYILRKKILHADALIRSGVSASKAAEAIGYDNYPSFFYNYKKLFGHSPKCSKNGK